MSTWATGATRSDLPLLKRANRQPSPPSPLKVFKNRLLISPSLLRADGYVAISEAADE